MARQSVIRVGQMVILPVGRREAAARADARSRSDEPGAQPHRCRVTPAPAATRAEGIYVVRRGDSIERIATRLGVEPARALAANDIRNRNVIQVGQQLHRPEAPVRRGRAAVSDDTLAACGEPSSPSLRPSPAAFAAVPAAIGRRDGGAGTGRAREWRARAGRGRPRVRPSPTINALENEQDVLAADPSDYSVSGERIKVQALETLGHYADWLERADAAAARSEFAVKFAKPS